MPVYTVGHSTRPIEDFIHLMKTYAIETVVDVRKIPKSRRNPQYWQAALRDSLAGHGIAYVWLEGLGGRRSGVKESVNTGWQNPSFRAYADYMQTAAFEASLERLIVIAADSRTAIMCAEAVPWRCHRSLIADALLVHGIPVEDIISATSCKPHKLTSFARVSGTSVTYPAPE